MKALYFILFVISLFIGACSSPSQIQGGTARPTYIPHPNYEVLNNNVRYLDRELARRVGVQATDASLNPTGTVQAWATFQNYTDYHQCLEARTVFLTGQREIVDGPTAWYKVQLPPNGIERYACDSIIEPRIQFYRIETRYCR